MTADPTRRSWLRRHPVLMGIMIVWAVIWGAVAIGDYDNDLAISIAAWLVFMLPMALLLLGYAKLADRWPARHNSALTAPPTALPSLAASGQSASPWQQQVDELTTERQEFDRDLQQSEAAQWRRMMGQRHAGAAQWESSSAAAVPERQAAVARAAIAPVSPAGKPEPPGSGTGTGKEDEFCPECGARFGPNDRFCPSCGTPRDTH